MVNLTTVGLARIKLTQRRFANGALYVAAVLEDSELCAIDIRFYAELDTVIAPTRSGFRVYRANIGALGELFERQPRNVGHFTLWSSGSRSLVARSCADEYGVGVDVRYFKISDTYEGWEKRGIRLRDEDFLRLGCAVTEAGLLGGMGRSRIDLFAGKCFSTNRRSNRGQLGKVDAVLSKVDVNDALAAFLLES
jgi:hypothetical protein